MTPTLTESYRTALQRAAQELTGSLRNAMENLQIEHQAEDMERMVANIDRAATCFLGDKRRQKSLEIRAALLRIESGEYGECGQCGENINPRRLDAIPWASLCIRCQDEKDQAGSTTQVQYLEDCA